MFDKKRYLTTKTNYDLYRDKLSYDSIEYHFFDKEARITSKVINGETHDDDVHFNKMTNLILSQYTNDNIFENKTINSFVDVPFFVQHGDCKNSNIIWKSNHPIIIDLEAIGPYPILYDYFYYVFMTKKDKSLEYLKSMSPIINKKFAQAGIGCPLDYYLSCYLSYLTKYLSKEYSENVVNFYLGWITYSDYSFFPLLKQNISDVIQKAKSLGYDLDL